MSTQEDGMESRSLREARCTAARFPSRAGSRRVVRWAVTHSQIRLQQRTITAPSEAAAGDEQGEGVTLEDGSGGWGGGRGL